MASDIKLVFYSSTISDMILANDNIQCVKINKRI